ncbi:hypothetical protein niasHT_029470 [Heterodera trifolii]|uniref:Intraflagellar transport protein 172 n=1 Tax=Heterodera trifolii TaxID=157864 RepID=A0ABD2KI99_9BILA
MRLKYLSSVVSASDEISCAGALCYSPNGRKLAVGTPDRHILLFDDKFRRRDKFGTKPMEPKFGKMSYLVKCAVFSPDSAKLAVGQTDHIVFVYRLGDTWNEKKVICNKFAQSSAVMAQCWPTESKLIIGLLDGKVRCASASSNKCSTLYRAETAVTVLAQHPNRKSFLSGHSDGTIFLYSFETRSHARVCVHPCAPQALLLSAVGILAAGTDRRIVSYSEHGRQLQQFDYSRVDGEKEFSAAALDALGHNAVFGSFNRIRLMCWNQRRGAWDEANSLIIHNLYTVCSLAWKSDGSTLICANILGAVIAIDCAMRKTILRNRFEVTFVSPSQAIIKDLKLEKTPKGGDENGEEVQMDGVQQSCVLRSAKGHELGDIRIMGRDQRYAIAYTTSTLILADMHTGLSSEIQWQSGRNEKFFLENENVAYIVNAGEISFVEYGRNELVGWIRTERANPHLISVRLYRHKLNKPKETDNDDQQQPRKWPNAGKEEEISRVAYLLDAKTIAVVNLINGVQLAQLGHGSPIDWLELNERANKLLFRDLRAALHLYSLENGITTHLVGHCSYVQWVPRSDVIVAQSNEQICVWYNTDEQNGSTERVVNFTVQGEVEQVARDLSRTEVIVLENGVQRVAYELDSALIEFGTALDELDLGRAVAFLEQSERQGIDVQTMWRRLAQVALQHGQLMVAQRCFASLNDIVRVQFLQQTQMRAERQFGGPMEAEALAEHFEVRARLAMIAKQFKMAERIYLENNATAEAIAMWQRMGNWDQALELAKAVNWAEFDQLRAKHQLWLEETGQMEKVAELKAREGLLHEALEMFLSANQPGKAADLLLENKQMLQMEAERLNSTEEGDEQPIVERIYASLAQHEQLDKAGQMFEAVGQLERALDCFRRGHSYAKAIQIARVEFPERVLTLESEWADWLFEQANYSQAVPHFLEAGNLLRAIESSIRSREWEKALEILQVLEPSDETRPFYGRIAQHFELDGQLDKAERLYVDAANLADAIEMYNKAGRWVDAYKLALELLGPSESHQLYLGKALELEEAKKFQEAEQLYVALGEPNAAISMYKIANRIDDMMRLMGRFHVDEMHQAHRRLAQELEDKGDLRGAEEQFLLSGDWTAAVEMYERTEQWADAHRIALNEADNDRAHKQVAYQWAKSLGGDSAVKLLNKHQLLEETINMAITKNDFDFAFELCRLGASHRLPLVQQKFAEKLEDDGKFEQAEEMYLKAGKAREAVLMHMHHGQWEAAERIAQEHSAEQLPELFVRRAKAELEEKEYAKAESFLLRANRADIILTFYRESAMWPEALRIAKDFLPDELQKCQNDYEEYQLKSGAKGVQSIVAQAKEWERQNEYRRAVDCWTKVDGATNDTQMVAQALAKAAEITVKFLADSEDGVDILAKIAQRQMEMGQFLAAGETFLLANKPTESIEALLEAHEWAKAKRVAEELVPELEAVVEERYRDFLRSHGRIGELADVDAVGAIDLLVETGQWEKALQTAKQQNHRPLLDKYLSVYTAQLLASGNYGDALDALQKYGISTHKQMREICEQIVEKVINDRQQEFLTLAKLRDVLFDLCQQIQSENSQFDALTTKQIQNHLYLAHFCVLRNAFDKIKEQLQNEGKTVPTELQTLALRLGISQLRYIEPLRADKAFYEAGNACRLYGGVAYEGMAFTLLSHYLDVVDAIEEDDPNLVDNSIFDGTDVPISYALPRNKFLTPQEHEEVKEWVLAASVGQNVELEQKVLKMDERNCYEASTVDNDGNLYSVCSISGYPLIDEARELGNGLMADHWAWTSFSALANTIPTDELYDVRAFLAKWSS